ncbi:MAG: hypothetical protein L6V84_01900 [Oscillospiraceae bacterium]|nr:MAG: hypothetical protein L6V84_01900 [Oscillospiraceae bacterium]
MQKTAPAAKKRSKVWRVVTTILIVLAALLLLAVALIGTYIGLKMKKFNDRNQGTHRPPPGRTSGKLQPPGNAGADCGYRVPHGF